MKPLSLMFDYSTEDLRERIKELTGSHGVDVVVDPVGSGYSEPALRSMAWNGRFLVIGFTAGDIPHIPLNLTLLKAARSSASSGAVSLPGTRSTTRKTCASSSAGCKRASSGRASRPAIPSNVRQMH